MLDAIVIGAGPAGLAAATWLGRHRCTTLVIDSGEYRNASVAAAHGYLGFDGVNPADLRARARRDLERYTTVTIRPGAVSMVAGELDSFEVTVDTETVRGRRLVLATGVVDRFPIVEGFDDHYGVSAFHCPTCDGFEARDKAVVALGWTTYVVGFTRTLLGWARSVTVVTEGHPFHGDERHRRELADLGVGLVEDDAVALVGEPGALRAVRLASGNEIPCELLFFAIGHNPRSALAQQLGCVVTEEGCVEVDAEGQTSIEGVWACGDLVPAMQIVQVAAATGAVAGISCARSLAAE